MQRILLTIEYDGTNYCGWQRQDNAITIQQKIEDTIEKVQGEFSVVEASGRTDAGVHAISQMAHFDAKINIDDSKWSYVLNNLLPSDIRIKKSKAVDGEFHARYLVKDKTYKYVIYNNRINSALYRNYSYFVPFQLDISKMRKATKFLIGQHDFFAFMSAKSDKENTIRIIYDCRIVKNGDFIEIYVRGNGFLHNMVRIIAGTLTEIGRGRLKEDVFEKAILNRDRNILGITAKSQGLFLQEVTYYNNLKQKLENT